jgi:hypothetical protein
MQRIGVLLPGSHGVELLRDPRLCIVPRLGSFSTFPQLFSLQLVRGHSCTIHVESIVTVY